MELFYQEESYKEFKTIDEIKNHVNRGNRLQIDDKMPIFVDTMIRKCWCENPDERPCFSQIVKMVQTIQQDENTHLDLDANVSLSQIEHIISKRTLKLQKYFEHISKSGEHE